MKSFRRYRGGKKLHFCSRVLQLPEREHSRPFLKRPWKADCGIHTSFILSNLLHNRPTRSLCDSCCPVSVDCQAFSQANTVVWQLILYYSVEVFFSLVSITILFCMHISFSWTSFPESFLSPTLIYDLRLLNTPTPNLGLRTFETRLFHSSIPTRKPSIFLFSVSTLKCYFQHPPPWKVQLAS